MSWNPTVNPNGHVPVGTGQQVPTRDNRHDHRVVVNHGQHGPQQVVIRPDGRRIPPHAAAQMRGRAPVVQTTTVVVVEEQVPAVIFVRPEEEGVMRQIPGTPYGIVTKK